MSKLLFLSVVFLSSCSSLFKTNLGTSKSRSTVAHQIEKINKAFYEAIPISTSIVKGHRVPKDSIYSSSKRYNIHGVLIQEIHDFRSDVDSSSSTYFTNYQYDESGNLTERTTTINNLFESTDLFDYNQDSLVRKYYGIYEHFTPDDTEVLYSSMEICYFNSLKQLDKCDFYSATALELSFSEEYLYDSLGNLIVTVIKSTENTYLKQERHFNDFGDRVSETTYSNSGAILETIKYLYYNDRKLKEVLTVGKDNKVIHKVRYKYNSYDELTSKVVVEIVDSRKTKKKYLYKYDTYGNWIKEVEYINNQPKTITERHIQYY